MNRRLVVKNYSQIIETLFSKRKIINFWQNLLKWYTIKLSKFFFKSNSLFTKDFANIVWKFNNICLQRSVFIIWLWFLMISLRLTGFLPFAWKSHYLVLIWLKSPYFLKVLQILSEIFFNLAFADKCFNNLTIIFNDKSWPHMIHVICLKIPPFGLNMI